MAETVRAGIDAGAVRPLSLERINVDTTIQPKAIIHPLAERGTTVTFSRLYHKALDALVRQAKRAGIRIRQSYLRLAKQSCLKVQPNMERMEGMPDGAVGCATRSGVARPVSAGSTATSAARSMVIRARSSASPA